MLVDSHCHLDGLDLTPHGGELKNALSYAKQHDVNYMLCVCIDIEHFPNVLKIAEDNSNIFASVGLHPNEMVAAEPTEEQLVQYANHPKVVAIGETGLDYYRSEGDLTWQHERFRRHIRVAIRTQKQLIIHTRDAEDDTIKIMKEENASSIGGVMHCFTGTWEMAQKSLDLGFYISFSGIVTFKNAVALQEVAKKIPIDRMLIETDSPYLAPVPFRGKPNEPAYVKYVAEFIAQLRGVSYETIAQHTTENFFKLFKMAKL